MKSIDDVEFEIKCSEFRNKLDEIEVKFKHEFEDEKGETNDYLKNHYVFSVFGTRKVIFNFIKGSNLSNELKNECNNEFKNIFH